MIKFLTFDFTKVYNNISYNVNEIKGESIFGNQIILMAITFTIMSITLSSIYTSTDTTAGEKERGTLETILTFPIKRKDLVLGKYLAISISGLITKIIGIILSIISLYYVKNNFSIYENVIFNILDDEDRFIIQNEVILNKKGPWYEGYLPSSTYYRHRKKAYANFLSCFND